MKRIFYLLPILLLSCQREYDMSYQDRLAELRHGADSIRERLCHIEDQIVPVRKNVSQFDVDVDIYVDDTKNETRGIRDSIRMLQRQYRKMGKDMDAVVEERNYLLNRMYYLQRRLAEKNGTRIWPSSD